jgi:hypothetical protein
MAHLPWKPVVYLPTNLTVRLDAAVFQAEDLGHGLRRDALACLGGVEPGGEALGRVPDEDDSFPGRDLAVRVDLAGQPVVDRLAGDVGLILAGHVLRPAGLHRIHRGGTGERSSWPGPKWPDANMR